jgi:hypothetical protein
LEGKPIPPDIESEGYFCPNCDTFVKKGNMVCLGCHAEVAYGSTKQEWMNNFLIGFLGGLAIIFISLSAFLVHQFDWHISSSPWSIAIGIGLSLLAGHCFAQKDDSIKRTRPPRFFRHTII